MITHIDQLDFSKRYTYADYLTWQFEEQVELIHGKIFPLPSFPGTTHQRVSGNLLVIIGNFLKAHQAVIFHAPFDMRIPSSAFLVQDDQIDTVVQPDLTIICDPQKLDERGCQGAPDGIIEILSPSTSSKDLTEKFDLYQHAGVREYWVVYPFEATLLIYTPDSGGNYQLLRPQPFVATETVTPMIFPELEVDLKEVF